MTVLWIVPTLLSLLVLAAHFFRNDSPLLVLVCLGAPLLLATGTRWGVRAVQGLLIVGALEWVRTAMQIAAVRQEEGLPWKRMAVILGSVAVFTVASAGVYFMPALRRRLGVAS